MGDRSGSRRGLIKRYSRSEMHVDRRNRNGNGNGNGNSKSSDDGISDFNSNIVLLREKDGTAKL